MTASTAPLSSSHRATPREQKIRALWINAMLWTFQGWLTMFFVGAAYAKLTVPQEHLVLLLGWAALIDLHWVRLIGIAELLLALSLLAPLVGWKVGRPFVIAGSVGLLAVEALALGYHLAHADIGHSLVNLALLAMTLTILKGRRPGTIAVPSE